MRTQLFFLAGAAFVTALPSPLFCPDEFEEPCPDLSPPDSTVDYICTPPIVDGTGAKLPYTFKNVTPEQHAVNRQIEKAMGNNQCTYLNSWLQETYDNFGSDLASVYPSPAYIREEAAELAVVPNVCFIQCVDTKDESTIIWCNAHGCPIVGIDKTRVYMSPDTLIKYHGVDIVYNTSPCQNQYLTAISADLCPVLEPQDLGSTRFCEEACFSSLG